MTEIGFIEVDHHEGEPSTFHYTMKQKTRKLAIKKQRHEGEPILYGTIVDIHWRFDKKPYRQIVQLAFEEWNTLLNKFREIF